jgi:ATP-dependent DNA helicase RecG
MEVYPSLIPPVRYNGRVYIRIGPRKSIANEAEERRLSEKRTTQMKTYDVRPCPESTIDDLQIDILKTTYLPSAVDREIIQRTIAI